MQELQISKATNMIKILNSHHNGKLQSVPCNYSELIFHVTGSPVLERYQYSRKGVYNHLILTGLATKALTVSLPFLLSQAAKLGEACII